MSEAETDGLSLGLVNLCSGWKPRILQRINMLAIRPSVEAGLFIADNLVNGDLKDFLAKKKPA